MLKYILTFISFFSITFSNFIYPRKKLTNLNYVCTKNNINYYGYQNSTNSLSLPTHWINMKQDIYKCDNYKRVGEYKISYKIICGNLKTKRLIKQRSKLKVKKIMIPRKFLKHPGVYRGFKNKHEYIICVKKDKKKISHEHPQFSHFFVPFVKDV